MGSDPQTLCDEFRQAVNRWHKTVPLTIKQRHRVKLEFLPWRWRQDIPLNRLATLTTRYGYRRPQHKQSNLKKIKLNA
jgi:hypothetical protein